MTKRRFGILAVLLLCLTLLVSAAPETSLSRDLSWWVVSGGGGTLSEGAYSLSGTIGQAEAGSALEEGAYSLIGGYWYGAGEETERFLLYLPLAIR